MARTPKKSASTSSTPQNVAAYVRVSTEDQASSGLGIDAQRARCKAMATVKGWPDPTFYADEGVSGTKAKRPGLDKLLSDVASGAIDAVIILSLDRLGRKTSLILDLVSRITRHAILVSCKESFDTATPQGQFVLTIFAAMAQFERDLIGERTSAALKERSRRDGNIGRTPYGYERTPDGVAIDHEAAEVVRIIFTLRTRGLSLRDIADILNERQYKPPHSEMRWHHTGVAAILRNLAAYRGGNRGASSLKWPVILKGRKVAA